MIRIGLRVLFALVALAIAQSPAFAQSWEMSAFGGVTPSVALDHPAPELTDAKVRGGVTWGIQGARFFTPRLGAEAVLTLQDSALEVSTSAGSADLFSLTLVQFQANVVYQFASGTSRLQPFVFGGAGTTILSAPDLDSSFKPSFGFGGGLKYFPWTTVGFRGALRVKPTWLNDDKERGVCAPLGFCQGWLSPIELTLGATIRF